MPIWNPAYPLYRQALTAPQATALVAGGESYSYSELAEQASRVAGWLRSRSLAPDRAPRVGVLASRSLQAYAGILGACWAGATYVALEPRLPAARLLSILERARLDALVVDTAGATHFETLGGALPREALAPQDGASAPNRTRVERWHRMTASRAAPEPVASGHPIYIMFTSGTTGVPKGVVVRASNLVHFLEATSALYHLGPGDRVGQLAATSFDLSVVELFGCWAAGASLHVASGSRVDNHYGPTEATVACMMQCVTDPPIETPGRGIVAIGTPIRGCPPRWSTRAAVSCRTAARQG
ncbi:MAG: AMP-binding protein [Candidatus Wallbacteria bacterium]|nr:AMP-binding protein [Candidatus Wallbacteria bacterium]